MPWVRAKLRGNLVYARADESGKLVGESGRVEVRYNASDGRLYRAAAANLTVVDPKPLPDDACAPAEEVKREERPRAAGKGKASKGKRAAANGDHPTEPLPHTALAYSDGACSGNPGPAGLGVVIVVDGERIELSEYLGTATNNIAELTAVLRAVEAVAPVIPTVIYTDSSYAIGVLQKGWKAKANVELVAHLRRELGKRRVELRYVPGHAGVELNERADELARLAVETRSSARVVRSAASGASPRASG